MHEKSSLLEHGLSFYSQVENTYFTASTKSCEFESRSSEVYQT